MSKVRLNKQAFNTGVCRDECHIICKSSSASAIQTSVNNKQYHSKKSLINLTFVFEIIFLFKVETHSVFIQYEPISETMN